MRFTIEIILKGKPPFILPSNYRRNIVGFIRQAVKSSTIAHNTYNEYWGDNNNTNTQKLKPYTFFLSVTGFHYIDLDDKKYLQLNDGLIKLHISSSDSNFLSILYDGLINFQRSYKLFNYSIEFKEIFLKKFRAINANFVNFKILSPIIVRNIAIDGEKRKSMGYLACSENTFKDSLTHSILTLCKKLNYNREIKLDDIEIDTTECITTKIYHYQETIPGIVGNIGIKASEDVLGFIYDTGLGARRSQGFGMVDLVNEFDYHNMVPDKKPALKY
ncbi:MAG: CRISPR-associated endoribonuclease Cas6 [Spirochaetota bacterium]